MSRATRKERETFYAKPWAGKNRHYDIFKEGAIALVVVSLLVVGLSAIFSSPDDKAVTFKQWATDSPDTFYATMVSQLAGSSESAGYGPPYNSNSDGVSLGPLALQKWGGVTHPVDNVQDFVITPLSTGNPGPIVTVAMGVWEKASADQQAKWAGDYETALTDEAGANGDPSKVPAGDYGPVPLLATALLGMAQGGGYDNAMTGQGQFFQTDQTKQLLLMGDGGFMEDKAVADHLGGDQWGMMEEAGDWPGQQWLAFASFWYQLPAFNAPDDVTDGPTRVLTDNADVIIAFILILLLTTFFFTPFIPVLRDLPRWIPIHRLVWKQYYKDHGRV